MLSLSMPGTEYNRTSAFGFHLGHTKMELKRVYFPSVARSDMAMDLGHVVHYILPAVYEVAQFCTLCY